MCIYKKVVLHIVFIPFSVFYIVILFQAKYSWIRHLSMIIANMYFSGSASVELNNISTLSSKLIIHGFNFTIPDTDFKQSSTLVENLEEDKRI